MSWILFPILCAIIGYSTNWLAILMLFRPHRAVFIGKFKIPFTPGLVPKEWHRLSKKVAETVSENVLTSDMLAAQFKVLAKSASGKITSNQDFIRAQFTQVIGKLVTSLEGNSELEAWIVDRIHQMVRDNVGRFAAIFMDSNKIYSNIKGSLTEYLLDSKNQDLMLSKLSSGIEAESFEKMVEQAIAYVAERVPIKDMIEDRLNSMAVEEIERLIFGIVKKELHLIASLGGILGFIFGLLSLLF